MRIKIIYGAVVLALCAINMVHAGIAHTNLFNPYDILITPFEYGRYGSFAVAYEGVIKAHGFRDDDDEFCTSFRNEGNVLQLWQATQDGVAAIKGNDPASPLGQLAQLFLMDDNGTQAIFRPCADVAVNNLMFAARYFICPNITIGAYLPFLTMDLKNVTWQEVHAGVSFEDTFNVDFIKTLEREGHINLFGWQRRGLGDLAILGTGFLDFPQAKMLLKNVRLGLRGGLTFPTGKKSNENNVLGLPFGYDAGLGILAAAHIELELGYRVHFAIDTEFLHLFGTTRARRIKTDPAQTDLFLLNKAVTFREPGFTQHYTLYLDVRRFWRGFTAQIAYQYLKHNEDEFFICSDHFDIGTVNGAESLQEWTTHHMVFLLKYDFYPDSMVAQPTLTAFYKQGFNGKRSIVANTAGLEFRVLF